MDGLCVGMNQDLECVQVCSVFDPLAAVVINEELI